MSACCLCNFRPVLPCTYVNVHLLFSGLFSIHCFRAHASFWSKVAQRSISKKGFSILSRPHLMSQTPVLKKEFLISTYSFAAWTLEHTSALQTLALVFTMTWWQAGSRASPCHQMHSRGRDYEMPLGRSLNMVWSILRLHLLGVQAHLCI